MAEWMNYKHIELKHTECDSHPFQQYNTLVHKLLLYIIYYFVLSNTVNI